MSGNKKEKIFVSGDHAGFRLKEKIKSHLEKKGYSIEDLGPNVHNPQDDYPDFVIPLAKKVAKTKNMKGIILAGSGQGEVIAANKVKGIRAALYYGGSKKIIELSKDHNNANILSLGARFLTKKQAIQAVDLWLKTPFSNQARHRRRLKKIEKFERQASAEKL